MPARVLLQCKDHPDQKWFWKRTEWLSVVSARGDRPAGARRTRRIEAYVCAQRDGVEECLVDGGEKGVRH